MAGMPQSRHHLLPACLSSPSSLWMTRTMPRDAPHLTPSLPCISPPLAPSPSLHRAHRRAPLLAAVATGQPWTCRYAKKLRRIVIIHPTKPRERKRPPALSMTPSSSSGRRRSPSLLRPLRFLPHLADPFVVTAVSYWTLSPSPFSSSHAVATAPSSTTPAAACARRRRASGDHLVHRACPSPSPHHASTHQHSNSPAR